LQFPSATLLDFGCPLSQLGKECVHPVTRLGAVAKQVFAVNSSRIQSQMA